MSVIRSKRAESEMEFIHTARQLQVYTIQKCVGFPKRYTFYIAQPIANAATRVHELTKMANSVYPTNSHEVQLRRDYLLRANAELNSLVSQIEVAHELHGRCDGLSVVVCVCKELQRMAYDTEYVSIV